MYLTHFNYVKGKLPMKKLTLVRLVTTAASVAAAIVAPAVVENPNFDLAIKTGLATLGSALPDIAVAGYNKGQELSVKHDADVAVKAVETIIDADPTAAAKVKTVEQVKA